MLYRNVTLNIYPIGQAPLEPRPCHVRLVRNGMINVCFEKDGKSIIYHGCESGNGHYLLVNEDLGGRSSLHRFSESLILEGYWEEKASSGMWRIELGEVADRVSGEDKAWVDAIRDLPLDGDVEPILDAQMEAGTEEEEDWPSPQILRYRFPLRSDLAVMLNLPDDLSKREGKRLARFVESLSCEY